MQSGGEEEQDEEAHTPLPPPMEIIKDPSAQDEKVGRGWGVGVGLVYLPCCLPLPACSSFCDCSHTSSDAVVILLTLLMILVLPLLFLSQSSSLLTSMQSSSEVPSAAELVSAIEKLVKTKMVSVFAGLCTHSCGPSHCYLHGNLHI